MNYLLKFCDNKKSLVAIVISVVMLIFFLFLSLCPLNSKAATDVGDFIRIKLDPANKDLWEFFAPPNGQDGEFDVTVSSWTWLAQPYECALLLTEDIPFAADDEGIYWVADGMILSTTDGNSLSSDLGAPGANWKRCTDPSLPACKKDGAGIDAVPSVFNAQYGAGWDDKCAGSDCNLAPNDTYYIPKVDMLCEDTWMLCGAAETSCNTYNSKLYACNTSDWTLCTGTATPDCASGVCKAAAAACDTDPIVEISPSSKSGTAGIELSYTIKVTNDDDATCPTASRTFTLSRTNALPGSWTHSFNDISLTVAKGGASQSTTYKLKSAATASTGDYTFTIKATDSDGNDSKDGVYAITDCPAGITPGGNFKFIGSPPASLNGDTLNLSLVNGTGVSHFIYLLKPSGSSVASQNCPDGGFCSPSYTLFPSDPVGMWQGQVGLSVDCRVLFEVVECNDDGDCSGTDVCNGDNECEAAGGGGGGGGFCPSSLSCTTPITAATVGCDCNGVAATAANVGEYCCLMDSTFYSTFAACNTSPCGGGGGGGTCNNDDVLDAGEQCDGTDLDGKDCTTFGYTGGTLSCTGSCTFDTSACTGGGGSGIPCGLGTGELCNPLTGWSTIPDIAEGMLNYLLGLVGSIALLFLIIAGVMYMTAAGNEERITTAKKILTGALIGLAIVLLAYSLLVEIRNILGII